MLNDHDVLTKAASKLVAAGVLTRERLAEFRINLETLRGKEKDWADEQIALTQSQDKERRAYLSEHIKCISELLAIIEGKEPDAAPYAPASEPVQEAAE